MWASLPFVTIGIATPFTFIHAAFKRRTVGLTVSAAVYLPAWAVEWMFIDSEGTAASVSTMLGMILWLVGGVHAFAVRKQVYPPQEATANEHAVQIAQHRRSLREQARELAAKDPALARELGIGRPDRHRDYDDGGLVDVNHAPPHALALLPGMTPDLVDRIDRIRRDQGPFVSVEDLAVHADLPVHLVPQLGEYTIFLP